MRSRLAVLIKKELLLYYGMRNAKKEPNPARFALVLLILVGMAPAFWVYFRLLGEVHTAFVQLNQIPGYFMFAFLIAHVFLLFMGIPAFLGRFYGNRDNPILLPMPIPPGDILISRFIPVLLMQLATALVFLLPAIIIHAARVPMTVAQWVVAFGGIIATVIFPTVISAVVVLVIMRYTNFGRHSDKWKTIGILFMLVLLIGVQAASQQFAQLGQNENVLLELLTDNQSLIRNTATVFVPARWTGLGMAAEGLTSWMYAGLNLIIAFLSAWFMQWMGTRVYLHSLLTGTEMAKEKKKAGSSRLKLKQRHPILTVLLTEWRILLRTPAFAVNVLSTPLIVSVVWLMPLFLNRQLMEQLGAVRGLMETLPASLFVLGAILIGAMLGVFLSLFVETATSFSREGQAFWLRRVLPIRPAHEVLGRSTLNVLLTMATTLALLLVTFALIRYPWWVIPIVLLSAGFFSIPLTLAGLLIDSKRPKMDWEDPNQAVKQNLNSLFAALASIAYILVFVGAGYLLYQQIEYFDVLLRTGTIVFVAINAALSAILYWLLLTTLPKAMAAME